MHATGTIQSTHTYGTQGGRTCFTSTNTIYRSPDHVKLVRSRYRLWLHSTACHTCKTRVHATEGIHSACTYGTDLLSSSSPEAWEWSRWSREFVHSSARKSDVGKWIVSWSVVCGTKSGIVVSKIVHDFFALSADAPGTEQVDLSEPKSCNTFSFALTMANFVDSSNASFSKLNSNSFCRKDCLFPKFVVSAINKAFSKDCTILADLTDERLLETGEERDVWLFAWVCDWLVSPPATGSSTWEALTSGLMSLPSWSGIVQPWALLGHWTLSHHCCTYTCKDCKT